MREAARKRKRHLMMEECSLKKYLSFIKMTVIHYYEGLDGWRRIRLQVFLSFFFVISCMGDCPDNKKHQDQATHDHPGSVGPFIRIL
jgi:hypothetical protein